MYGVEAVSVTVITNVSSAEGATSSVEGHFIELVEESLYTQWEIQL